MKKIRILLLPLILLVSNPLFAAENIHPLRDGAMVVGLIFSDLVVTSVGGVYSGLSLKMKGPVPKNTRIGNFLTNIVLTSSFGAAISAATIYSGISFFTGTQLAYVYLGSLGASSLYSLFYNHFYAKVWENDTCIACFGNLDEGRLLTLQPCGHVIGHEACWSNAVAPSNCPICQTRADLPTVYEFFLSQCYPEAEPNTDLQ